MLIMLRCPCAKLQGMMDSPQFGKWSNRCETTSAAQEFEQNIAPFSKSNNSNQILWKYPTCEYDVFVYEWTCVNDLYLYSFSTQTQQWQQLGSQGTVLSLGQLPVVCMCVYKKKYVKVGAKQQLYVIHIRYLAYTVKVRVTVCQRLNDTRSFQINATTDDI